VCGQCWRTGNAEAMAFYAGATGAREFGMSMSFGALSYSRQGRAHAAQMRSDRDGLTTAAYAQKYGTPISITEVMALQGEYNRAVYAQSYDLQRLATAYDMNNMIASMKKSVADFELQTNGNRPGAIDIWNENKTAVLNGLLSHLYYMGHNPNEQYNLRDIVKSFNEPVSWWKSWIPGSGASNSTGGVAKIFGGDAQWFVGVAGNPNTDKWKTSPANMNLEMNGRARNGINFIDGTPATIFQITVWGGSGKDRLIYLNFLDKDIWNKTYNYLNGY